MRCPSCGEPIRSRHSFCVICGADLQDILSRTKREAVEEATDKIQSVLTKPLSLRGSKGKAAKKAVPEKKEIPPAVMAPPEESPEDSGVVPGFMRKYV